MTEATIEARATIPIYDAAALNAAADEALAEARRRLAVIERLALEAVSPESVLDAWDGIAMMLEDAYGAISLLNSVHPDAAVRDAGDRALIEESVFMTELFQNERLYERVNRVPAVTSAQKQLRKDLLEAFEDSGVALPPEKRQRFKEISERLEKTKVGHPTESHHVMARVSDFQELEKRYIPGSDERIKSSAGYDDHRMH